jgi:hypothetical protein
LVEGRGIARPDFLIPSKVLMDIIFKLDAIAPKTLQIVNPSKI